MTHIKAPSARALLKTLVGAGAVGALLAAGSAMAGIADTKHNLGSTTGANNNKFSGTAEICVFCHTPHGSDTSAAVPLWNRTLPSPSIYTTYDSLGTSTLEGKTAVVGSVSIACLSCHDGTQALNTVINAPGSGTTGDTTWTTGTWTSPNSSLTNGKLTSGIAALGTDLRNDHPIGIQYCGGGWSAANSSASGAGGTCADTDFRAPATGTIGGRTAWWVDTSNTTGRQKTDMILYARQNAQWTVASGNTVATVYEPFVECASCHDPHTSDNATFLRVSNSGSAVCLACHTK